MVLTSRYRTLKSNIQVKDVLMSLYLEMDLDPWLHSVNFFVFRKYRERYNLNVLNEVIRDFRPHIVFVWGMWNMNRSLAVSAETLRPGRVIYRFADFWPTLPSQHQEYWSTQGRHWFSRLPKRLIGMLALKLLARDSPPPLPKFEHAYCVSWATRQTLIEARIPIGHAKVIHTGINIESFTENRSSIRNNAGNTKTPILFVGRLAPEKGIETTIKAIRMLVLGMGYKDIVLNIAGTGSKEYELFLKQMAFQDGLSNTICFLGRVTTEGIPALYRESDILVVPSEWQEPLSRVLLEGMASGLAVISTPYGGTSEAIIDEENGLLFTPGDSLDLAREIERLILDPELRRRIAQNARNTVVEKFSETKMLDQVEACLFEITNSMVRSEERRIN